MRNFRIQAVTSRAKGLFDGFTPGQRAVTVIAVIVAVVGGVVFLNWAAKPAMAPLFSGLSSTDASAIVTKLQESGTSYELADGGRTIMVPRADVDKKRIDLAGQGLPANTGNAEGYSLVDKLSLTSSDFQQRLTAKRAVEGELKKAIEQLDAVQSATVALAIPEQDVFTNDQAKPSASVLVRPRPAKSLSSGNVEAIVHLVSASVPKLDATKVTVTDSTGKLLSAPGVAGGAGGDARLEQAATVSAQKAKIIQALLDKAVGVGNSSVSVDAQLDFDNTTVQTNEYINMKPGDKPLQSETTKESLVGAGNQAVGGVLGPDNLNVPNGVAGSQNQKYDKTTEKNNNPIGTKKTDTIAETGRIKRLGIAVIINSRTAGAANVAQITKAVTAAAGADPARGDIIDVSKMAFDTVSAENAAKEAEAVAAAERQAQLLDLAKSVGLGLLLLAALLLGYKKSRRRTTTVELGELPSAAQPELPEAIMPPPLEYQLDDEDDLKALEATPVDPQGEARVTARAEIGLLVKENPDEVARLLRGWISERS